MSKNDFPKADNTRVLRPYSKSMKNLLKKKSYNSGNRPSEHKISAEGFLKNNKGSIAHNFLEMEQLDEARENRLPHNVLSFSNTSSNDYFLKICRNKNIIPHPARMNPGVVSFFINFLTSKGDIILDPFAGSNTTGLIAQKLKRKWISFEIDPEFAKQSKIRFEDPSLKIKLY
jgi:site-specific DNA-methyltransferase (cytosine-N4-specific)